MIAIALAFAAPAPVALDAAARARLAAGGVVVLPNVTRDTTESTGVIRASAAPERLWRAMLDFPARLPENPSLKDVSVYERDGDRFGVRFELAVFGVRAVTHERWTCAPSAWACTYTLDTGRENDVEMDEGWMLVTADGSGSTLTFYSTYRSTMWTPAWLRRWLATDSMETVLTGIARRAERH